MPNATQWAKIKANPDKYEKEKQRIGSIIMNRYNNDPEFRQRLREKQKAYYHQKKNLINNIEDEPNT
jgi:hypothetical protein